MPIARPIHSHLNLCRFVIKGLVLPGTKKRFDSLMKSHPPDIHCYLLCYPALQSDGQDELPELMNEILILVLWKDLESPTLRSTLRFMLASSVGNRALETDRIGALRVVVSGKL